MRTEAGLTSRVHWQFRGRGEAMAGTCARSNAWHVCKEVGYELTGPRRAGEKAGEKEKRNGLKGKEDGPKERKFNSKGKIRIL